MKVLLTGGAGYIGSVTAKALEVSGHVPVILDSLVTGPRDFVRGRIFYCGDIADRDLTRKIVREHPEIACAIHMAARTVVGESVSSPYMYYKENVTKSLELFDELASLGCDRVVLSSSASVYAASDAPGVNESSPLAPGSPYAQSKAMVEAILRDLCAASSLRAVILRYFNPIGSDPELESGAYRENPPHVLGQLLMAAYGDLDCFQITGTDYPTRDGSGVRDYIHVWDLALAHVRAVERFDEVIWASGATSDVFNIGTGSGTTVRELLEIFESLIGRKLRVREADARAGDSIGAFALVDKAARVMGWRAEADIAEAVSSALRWEKLRRG